MAEPIIKPEDPAAQAARFVAMTIDGRLSDPARVRFIFTARDGTCESFDANSLANTGWWRLLPMGAARTLEAWLGEAGVLQ